MPPRPSITIFSTLLRAGLAPLIMRRADTAAAAAAAHYNVAFMHVSSLHVLKEVPLYSPDSIVEVRAVAVAENLTTSH